VHFEPETENDLTECEFSSAEDFGAFTSDEQTDAEQAPSACISSKRRGRKRKSPENKSFITQKQSRANMPDESTIAALRQTIADLMAKQTGNQPSTTESTPEERAKQQNRTRKNHVQMFMMYRSNGVLDDSCWSEILKDDFSLVLPCTPFCQSNGTLSGDKRKLNGISQLVEDTETLSKFVSGLSTKCKQLKPQGHGEVLLKFQTKPDDILVIGEKAMCHWSLTTEGLPRYGFAKEAHVDGMLHCEFTQDNKIASMEMTFDVNSFAKQIASNGLLSAARPSQPPKVPSNHWNLPPVPFFGAVTPKPNPSLSLHPNLTVQLAASKPPEPKPESPSKAQNQDGDTEDPADTAITSEEKPKRRVGRPRKIPLNPDEPPKPKGKRGRKKSQPIVRPPVPVSLVPASAPPSSQSTMFPFNPFMQNPMMMQSMQRMGGNMMQSTINTSAGKFVFIPN